MAHFDATNADVEVHAFKEGLLAAMGHDLKIRVTRFAIDIAEDRSSLTATFDPDSLVVESVLDGGEVSAKDRAEIEANIRKKVLHPQRHPEISFASTAIEPVADGLRITGELTLHGTSRTLSVCSHRVGHEQIVEVPLHQPDFGIKPFKAPLGVIKIKPEVHIRVSLKTDIAAS